MRCTWISSTAGSITSSSTARPASSASSSVAFYDVEAHQVANRSYVEEGIQRLELAHKANQLFRESAAKRETETVGFVLSNCRCKGGELEVEYRQPLI